jgi:hypothetical protein
VAGAQGLNYTSIGWTKFALEGTRRFLRDYYGHRARVTFGATRKRRQAGTPACLGTYSKQFIC